MKKRDFLKANLHHHRCGGCGGCYCGGGAAWLTAAPHAGRKQLYAGFAGGTSAWSGDTLPDKTPEGSGEAVGIKIPGYPSISLPANKQDAEVALLNPEGNPCYFTFELVLTDTDEVLYTSKQVEPGQMIANITLNRALPAGQYNAELRITTASLQDGSAMNRANVVTVLDVQ